ATVNGTVTYTLNVTNNGPSAATGVTLTDTLPASTTFVSVMTNKGSCTGTSTVNCNLGTLASGASATITIAVTPTAVGTISNTASVTGSEFDPNTANNSASVTTMVNTPAADLVITKTASPNPVTTGGSITYTIVLSNNGMDSAS